MNKTASLEILVFATNIFSTDQMNIILEKLLTHPGVKQANFDLEDVDKVLRVVSCGISESEVEKILQHQYVYCKALT
ncbi:hypothetical protein [Galbibacter sp. PAP.153]|uniref:hypothetical protein n=1 Tax=Galbibacter sp. PAP.153 TaxID=3104623 RepID=UPI00300AA37B